MNVAALLASARSMIDDPEPATTSVWPRGAAVLTRQGIETTLEAYWTHHVPAMRAATRSEQWLALPSYLGRTPVVPAAEYSWAVLSEACHHRGYEVGLTADELRAHVQTAEDFRGLVGAAVVKKVKG